MSPLCPTREELDSFQAGDLEETALASVSSHVESCPNCQRSLETIIGDSADTVLHALLAEPEPATFANEAACRLAIERVAAIAAEVAADAEKFAPTVALELGPNPADDVLPLDTIREYKLLAKLGEGGMGAVYKALHTRLDKVVALKVLPQGRMRDSGSVARFQREMKAVGRLDHPNIVRAMDAGEEDGTHFLVMEYVEGADLSLLAKNVGPLPVADACELIRQAAIGLQEAHEHGMVHRDIKPSNLILAKPTRKKSPPTLKILDLGLALLAEALAPDQGLTSTGQMMGTIDYMAPEQGSDTHRVDIRADIYSLGATLYRLLTGSAPFAGEKFDTPVKKILALATKEPAAVGTLRADVPPALAAIIHKLLAKDPAERYATPEELAEALTPFCQGANLAVLLERGTRPDQTKVSGEAPTHPQLSSPSVATAPTIDYSIKEAKKPRPASTLAFAGLGRKIPRSFAIMAACGGAALVVLLGVVFYLETLKGTIRIEINDPAINVVLDEGRATFQGAHDKHKIRVESGQHGLTITCGDLKFHTEKFELRKGDILRLSVTFLEGKVEVVDVARNKPLEMTQILPPKASVNLAGTALEFDGKDDYVSLPKISYDFKSPLTFEAWVTPAQSQEDIAEKQAQCLWSRVGCSVELTHWGWQFYCTKRSLIHGRGEAGNRYHLVAQWDGKRCTLFVNGQSATKENAEDFDPAAILPRMLGAGGDWGGRPIGWFFRGRIEEVRVSSVLRYHGDFSAPDPSEPFAADKSTLALYHFDEGQGTELKDSSGHNYHGKIVGAKWVRSDGAATKALAGWQGWPKDAPKPAIAPFTAEQARQLQEEWADYLGVPVEHENSIGMKFVLIPPGEFLMGSTTKEVDELLKVWDTNDTRGPVCIKSATPQHRVILTRAAYASVHEVRQRDYQSVMGANPSVFAKTGENKDLAEKVADLDTADFPVDSVSWLDATDFCSALSRREKLQSCYSRVENKVTLREATGYRLPSEAEWEFTCRAGRTTPYWVGDGNEDLYKAGWFGGNSGGRRHAVGELQANPFGLYDLHGNAWEWVQDWWEPSYQEPTKGQPTVNPQIESLTGKSERVLRGGNWRGIASLCRSSFRDARDYWHRHQDYGFRVWLSTDAVKAAFVERKTKLTNASTGWHGWPKDAPQPAIAPFDAKQARKHQQEWADKLGVPVEYENTLGMKFVLIPPGEFLMGSTKGDPNEAPVHKIAISAPYYLGVYEVTQEEYKAVVAENPSKFPGDRLPVESVTSDEALAYCRQVAEHEGLAYRLPTEAEWELACRAGTTTDWSFGDEPAVIGEHAWCKENGGGKTHPVGGKKPNAFGLFDMHGNVFEYCADYTAAYSAAPEVDPKGPKIGRYRGFRGGSWFFSQFDSRSADRQDKEWPSRGSHVGFRVALDVNAVRKSGKNATQPSVPDQVVDLLKLVDVERDSVKGKWTRTADGLASDAGIPYCRLKLPYSPPPEYDFRVEFTAQGGNDILQLFTAGGRSCTWLMGAWGGKHDGFDTVKDHPLTREGTNIIGVPTSIRRGQRHTAVVQVRRDSITATIDGKLVVRHATDGSDLGIPGDWSIGEGAIGLGTTFDAVVFHKVEARVRR